MPKRLHNLTATVLLSLLAASATAADVDLRNMQGIGDVRYHALDSTTLERTLHISPRRRPLSAPGCAGFLNEEGIRRTEHLFEISKLSPRIKLSPESRLAR